MKYNFQQRLLSSEQLPAKISRCIALAISWKLESDVIVSHPSKCTVVVVSRSALCLHNGDNDIKITTHQLQVL